MDAVLILCWSHDGLRALRYTTGSLLWLSGKDFLDAQGGVDQTQGGYARGRHCSGSQSVTAQPWPIWALEIRVAGTSPHFWAAFPCAGLTHSLWTHTDTQIFISRAYRLKQTHARLLLHALRCAQPRPVYLCYVPSSQKHPPQLLLEGTAMITPASQPGWQPSALPRRWR